MAERTLELKLIATDKISGTFSIVQNKLKDFGNKFKATGSRIGSICRNINKKIAAIGPQISKVGKKFSQVGRDLSLKVTAPLVAMGVGILKVAGDFEAGMNRVAGITNATEEEMKALTAQARKLGKTTQYSAAEASDAMKFLGMAGFKTNEIMTALPATLQLAAAGNVELANAADIASNILSGYGFEAKKLAEVNDILVKAFTSANVDLNMLGESMKYIAPLAAGMKIPFEDTTTAIALLGKAGIQASMAGTTLRSTLSVIATSLTASGEALNSTGQKMQALGLNFYDSEGNIKSFTEIIKEMETKGLSATEIMDLFGRQAGPGLQALMHQGSAAMVEFRKGLENAGGIAKKVSDQNMEGFNGAVRRMVSAFQELAIAIADSGLMDFLTKLIGKFTNLITKLSESKPWLLKTGVIFGAIAAAIGPVVIALGFLMRSVRIVVTVISLMIKSVRTVVTVLPLMIKGVRTIITVLPLMIKGVVAATTKLKAMATQSVATGTAIQKIGKAGAVVGAFYVGWKIGKYIGEKFTFIQKAAAYFSWALSRAFEVIQYKWEQLKAVFSGDTMDEAFKRHEERVKAMGAALDTMIKETSKEYLGAQANQLRENNKVTAAALKNEEAKQEKIEKTIAKIEEMNAIQQSWAEKLEEQAISSMGKIEQEQARMTKAIEEAKAEITDPEILQKTIAMIEEYYNNSIAKIQEETEVATQSVDELQQHVVTAAEESSKETWVAPEQAVPQEAFDRVDKLAEHTKETAKQMQGALESATTVASALLGGLASQADEMYKKMIEEGVTETAAQFTVGQWWKKQLSGAGLNIPVMGAGGIVTSPTLAMIGESGPEKVVPLNKEKPSVGSVVLNITGPVMGNRAELRLFAREFKKILDEETARGLA